MRPVSSFATLRSPILGTMLLLAAGCNPIYYSPTTHNVPLFERAGEMAGSGALDGNRYELQAAYALTDAVGVLLNGGLFRPDDLDSGDGGSGHFLEAGIGLYRPLNDAITGELYGILGFGSFENHFPFRQDADPGTRGNISGRLVRYGFQPSLGYRSANIEAAVSMRTIGITYSGVEGDLRFGDEDQATLLRDNSTYLLLEPAFTIRGGVERLKLQVQLGRSINLTNSDFPQDDSHATFGVIFRP